MLDLLLDALNREEKIEKREEIFKQLIIPMTIEYRNKTPHFDKLHRLIKEAVNKHPEFIQYVPEDMLETCVSYSQDNALLNYIISSPSPELQQDKYKKILGNVLNDVLMEEKELISVVENLLKANTKIPSNAIHLAITNNHLTILQMLLDAGADYTHKLQGDTPLSLAIKSGNEGAVRILLDKGVIADNKELADGQSNKSNLTILSLLKTKLPISKEQFELLREGFERTALSVGDFMESFQRDKVQAVSSVLIYAMNHNNSFIIDQLCARNQLKLTPAELKEVLCSRTQGGNTILHWLFSQDNLLLTNKPASIRLELLHRLIKNGANFEAPNQSGITPLFLAKIKNDFFLAYYLGSSDKDKIYRAGHFDNLEKTLQKDKKEIISSKTARVLMGDPNAIQEMAGYFNSSGRALLINACAYIVTPEKNKVSFLTYIKEREFRTKFSSERIKLLELKNYLVLNLENIRLLANQHPDLDPITLILLHLDHVLRLTDSPSTKAASEKLKSSLISLLRDELGANPQQIENEMSRRNAIVYAITGTRAASAPPPPYELPPPAYEDPFAVNKPDDVEVKKEATAIIPEIGLATDFVNDMPLPSAPTFLPEPEYSQIEIPVALPVAPLVITEPEVHPVVLDTPLVEEEKTVAMVFNNPAALFTKSSEIFSFADFSKGTDVVLEELEKKRLDLEKVNEFIDSGMSTPKRESEKENIEEKPIQKRKPLVG